MKINTKRRLLVTVCCAAAMLISCGESSQGEQQQTTSASATSASPTTTLTTTTTAATSPTTAATTQTTAEVKPKSKAQQLLEKMTLEEKIGQLFVVRATALDLNKTQGSVTVCDDGVKTALKQYHVGGVVYFTDNIKDPQQLTKLSSDLQAASEYPLFITADEEGGNVTRIAQDPDFNVKQFASMLTVGSTGDTAQAHDVGQTIGKYMKDYGMNLDLAPVADIFSNPYNTVIGDRAFGRDANSVSLMVNACVKGFHEQGMMTCLKHFPGHGDTAADSHYGAAVVDRTWSELLERELVPFIASLGETDMVMAAHVSVPKVTGDNTPASLSKTILTDKLRNELGFNGVIITDSLGMGAVTKGTPQEEIPVKVLEAGGDILLMPASLPTAFNGVLNAVKSGRLSENRIEQSVKRILDLKEKYGLI
ncbi:MAG: glycoside hydrolase family 3 protein [Ruminococcus sp.]|nr:glycoside hydrolase family 3 protein [Ruminococcus sp.]